MSGEVNWTVSDEAVSRYRFDGGDVEAILALRAAFRAGAAFVTPSDTFASTKPSDAEHLLSVVETIKETGGSVQIRGVLITPCDTYGQPLTSVRPDADVVERIAGAIVRGADPAYMLTDYGDDDYSDGYRLGIRDAAQIARQHVTPPAAATGEGDDRG